MSEPFGSGAAADADDARARIADDVRRAMWGEDHLERVALLRERDPELARIVLHEHFGNVYADGMLTPQERALVTVATLVAENRESQLRSHLEAALRLGVTEKQLIGLLRHQFLYLGLPRIIEAHKALVAVLG